MPTLTAVQTRSDALHQKVLDTALLLFSEQGYFNTSVHDIRRAAGVSTGAIYHHFQNKEALAKSLYDRLLAQMDAELQAAVEGKESCLERCDGIIARLFQLAEEQPRVMQFVLQAQHREYLRDEPPICSSEPFQFMRQVIEEGIEAGEVRELDPWVAATAMFGGALRMMNLQFDEALAGGIQQHLSDVVDCGWRAIKA